MTRRRWAASSGLTGAEALRGGTAWARVWKRGHGGGAAARQGGSARGRGEIGGRLIEMKRG
jgi:hypothetical protein